MAAPSSGKRLKVGRGITWAGKEIPNLVGVIMDRPRRAVIFILVLLPGMGGPNIAHIPVPRIP